MLEKWKQKAIQMNMKKAVTSFVVVSAILMIVSSGTLYARFRDKINTWEATTEDSRGHGKEESYEVDNEQKNHSDPDKTNDASEWKERDEIDFEQIYMEMKLSVGDIAILLGCVIIGVVLLIWYWILCMIWAYRKADRIGVNCAVWVLASFFFNLAAIAVLYLWTLLKGTCEKCGRIKNGRDKFCERCGAPLRQECPQCKQDIDTKAHYCSNCGQKLNK